MQLDDVVHSSISGPRLEEATHRSLVIIECLDSESVSKFYQSTCDTCTGLQ